MTKWGDTHELKISDPSSSKRWTTSPVYQTDFGAMYCGESKHVIQSPSFSDFKKKVQLVFTSPPFPLNTKKNYGNLQGEEYIEWFASFAPVLTKLLRPDGSIVIEIGNAWEPGRPVMSTTVLRALLRFLEKGGLNLCQEFVWYNPARLPSPVQWVNVERIRVKDAFTRVWWMSPSDRPKADNRRVLREYSPSMKKLLGTGVFNSGARPSQHKIGVKSFATNNKGAIPPNVFDAEIEPSLNEILNGEADRNGFHADQVASNLSSLLKSTNTSSHESFQNYCRLKGIQLHPARMPPQLVEYFVRFLTDKGDLVMDPFGGSNTTGSVAESLGRRWLSIEAQWRYATSSIARFAPADIIQKSKLIEIERVRKKRQLTQNSKKRQLTKGTKGRIRAIPN